MEATEYRSGLATGYNYVHMGELFNQAIEIAAQVTDEIQKDLDENLVQPMTNLWFAPEAKTYFKDVNKIVEEAGDEVKNCFQNFVDNVSNAQNTWSENTGNGEKANPDTVKPTKLSINYEAFKDEKEGSIVLYKTQAREFADGLQAKKEALCNKILAHKGDLKNSSAAFLGDDQGAAVDNFFDGILTSVGKIFDFLSGGDNSLAGGINAAADKYEKIASEIASGMKEAADAAKGAVEGN